MSKPPHYRFLRFIYRNLSFPAGVRYSLRRFFRSHFAGEKRVSYKRWVRLTESMEETERPKIEEKIRFSPLTPTFSLLVFIFGEIPTCLPRLIASVGRQLYPRWELLILPLGSFKESPVLEEFSKKDERIRCLAPSKEFGTFAKAFSYGLGETRGDYIGLLGAQGILSERALIEVVCALEKNPALKIVYTDEDSIDENENRDLPIFKPDWSPELFLSQNYLGDLTLYQRQRLMEISAPGEGDGIAGRFDLTLKFVTELDSSQIGHIPKVLYHEFIKKNPQKKASGKNYLPEKFKPSQEGMTALQAHLERQGIPARAEIASTGFGYRIRSNQEKGEKVCIIIPSACKLSFLKPCLESLFSRTVYPEFDVLLVVNEIRYSVPEQGDYLDKISKDPRIRILVYENQPFNYSKLNNWAVQHTEAPFVCLLNDDTEVISRDWLSEMVFWAGIDGVGAVGAKLCYPEGRIQHAGVILGLEGGLHAFRFFPGESFGYMGRLQSVGNCSAVTGACLMVRRDLYQRVGGLDEEAFPVAFNDIDFCLRLGVQGFRTVWTPYAELIHKESVSRGFDDTPEKEERFHQEFEVFESRWKDKMEDDPFYNPNLSHVSEDFSLRFPPRIRGSCPGKSG